ncbi:MAG: hypothetical protein AABY83_03850 [Pseudomonadota bacterium]
MHTHRKYMRCIVRVGLPLYALVFMASAEAKPAPSVKVLTQRCTTEAHDAGISERAGEFNSYIKDCVRDLQDMRKQGIDLEGTHEDPAPQAAPTKKKKKSKKKKAR